MRSFNNLASRCKQRVGHRVTDGVSELKIDFGPGYRVYYTERDGVVIILLAGGDKSSQQKDIKTAIALAKGF